MKVLIGPWTNLSFCSQKTPKFPIYGFLSFYLYCYLSWTQCTVTQMWLWILLFLFIVTKKTCFIWKVKGARRSRTVKSHTIEEIKFPTVIGEGWVGAVRCIWPCIAYDINTVHPRLIAKSQAKICTDITLHIKTVGIKDKSFFFMGIGLLVLMSWGKNQIMKPLLFGIR